MRRAATLALALLCAPGCLVLSLQPAYDDETIAWNPELVGSWIDADDKVTMEVERGEWKSYRIRFAHPIESATVTAYLTAIGDEHFIDIMPARGEDRGSLLVPVHAVVHVRLDADRLELTPLSYDRFNDRLRARQGVTGLNVVQDQKENALIVSPTARLRTWLRGQPARGPMFGASAVFTRKKPDV
jgi:cytochrome c biogenesis protein ResB